MVPISCLIHQLPLKTKGMIFQLYIKLQEASGIQCTLAVPLPTVQQVSGNRNDLEIPLFLRLNISRYIDCHLNIFCGHSLKSPQWGDSKEYPQAMYQKPRNYHSSIKPWQIKKEIKTHYNSKRLHICVDDWTIAVYICNTYAQSFVWVLRPTNT